MAASPHPSTGIEAPLRVVLLEEASLTVADAKTELERFSRRVHWLAIYAYTVSWLASRDHPDLVAVSECYLPSLLQVASDVTASDDFRLALIAQCDREFSICGSTANSAHDSAVDLGRRCLKVTAEALFGIPFEKFEETVRAPNIKEEVRYVSAEREVVHSRLLGSLTFLEEMDLPFVIRGLEREFARVADRESGQHRLYPICFQASAEGSGQVPDAPYSHVSEMISCKIVDGLLFFDDGQKPYLGLTIEVYNFSRLVSREGFVMTVDFAKKDREWEIVSTLLKARESGIDDDALIVTNLGYLRLIKSRANKCLEVLQVEITRHPSIKGRCVISKMQP